MTVRRIYIAGPYAARVPLERCGQEAEQIGYSCTATWLAGKHEASDGGLGEPNEQAQWAQMDLRDIDRSDVLVAFTAAAAGFPQSGTSGGRHIETGYAIAKGKRVILVGDPENVFHALITQCISWHDALILLAAELVSYERQAPQAEDA